jgi:hypothetical protein
LQKLVFLIFNSALEPEVLGLLKGKCVSCYTRWDKVKGVGECGPHFYDDVWPAANIVIMCALDQEKKDTIAQGIKKIREEFPNEGIKMLVLPFEEIV